MTGCSCVLLFFAVFEILVAFVQNRDWKKAFYQVIPQRKQVTESLQASNSPTTVHESPPTASCACSLLNINTTPPEPVNSKETQTMSNIRQVCTSSDNISSQTESDI